MNTKEILDMVLRIVKRQDFDRTLALFLLNTLMKDLIRGHHLHIYDELKTVSYDVYGQISISSSSIKNILNVEWVTEDEQRKMLPRVGTYNEARENFDFTEVGEPSAYIVMGNTIKILPVPSNGTIDIFAEIFPSDLTDSISSSNSITNDAGNLLVFLVSAEYFDMIQEEIRGKYWREKGLVLLEQYLRFVKNREVQNIELMHRDPFGNNPSSNSSFYARDLDDDDMGTF